MKIQNIVPISICFLIVCTLTLLGKTYLHPGKASIIGIATVVLTMFVCFAIQDHDFDKRPIFKKKTKIPRAVARKG